MPNRDAAMILVLALLAPLPCQPADTGEEEAFTEAEVNVVTVEAVGDGVEETALRRSGRASL